MIGAEVLAWVLIEADCVDHMSFGDSSLACSGQKAVWTDCKADAEAGSSSDCLLGGNKDEVTVDLKNQESTS